MKRIAVLSALLLAIAVILSACKQAAPTHADVTETAGTAASDAAEQMSEQTENGMAGEGEADALSVPGSADGTSKAAASAATESVSGQTAKPDSSSETTTASGKTELPAVPLVPQNPTTPGAAQKPSTGTTAKPGNTTTKPGSTTTTKPGSTAASATEPGSTPTTPDGTKPSGGTAADAVTTTKPAPAGSAVTGTLSYLNNAPVTYMSAMNEDDLKAFGITGDKQKEILKNKKDWTVYTIQIDFRNNTDKPLTLYYLDVTDNGKGEIYVCGDTAGELGMAPGGRISEKFYVLARKGDTDIDVREKLSGMAMRVQYAETPADDNMTPVFQYSKIG